METSIFVGNIAYGAMEEEIRLLFSNFGSVTSVHFVMDHYKGRFRGFGFVTMPSKDANKAIQELDGTEFQGRELKVSEAQSSSEGDRNTA